MTDINRLVRDIKIADPTLVKFIETIFTLIEGSSSVDPGTRLSGKEIVAELARLPLIALRSKIILALYSEFGNDTDELLDNLNPSDWQCGVEVDSSLISIDGYNLDPSGEPIKDEDDSEDDYNLGIRDNDESDYNVGVANLNDDLEGISDEDLRFKRELEGATKKKSSK